MAGLVLGGTFNPIHHGHLICARAVAELMGLDSAVLVPSARPPHKPNHLNLAPAADRLEMCRLAVAGSHFFAVEDLEIHRQGASYTVDTARELRRRGWESVNWLIGSDTVPQLPTWHEAAMLLQEVRFIIMERPGGSVDWNALPPGYQKLRANVVAAPHIEISSTAIRARVAAGQAIDYLVPPAVQRYIDEHGLYKG